MRAIRTRYGARLVQGSTYLSKILARPGATHEVFDVLAAVVATVAPRGDAALLGFAGGGVIAPLRALGDDRPVHAVDLDTFAEPLFRSLCGSWCGRVTVRQGDAAGWLRRAGTRFATVIEDLSINDGGEVTKPALSHEVLPALVRDAIEPGGVVVVNALPVPGLAWNRLILALASDAPRVAEVRIAGYDNRIVVAGDRLPAARKLADSLRETLRSIRSRMAPRIRVRTVR